MAQSSHIEVQESRSSISVMCTVKSVRVAHVV